MITWLFSLTLLSCHCGQDLGLAQNTATNTKTPIPLGSLAHQIYRVMCSRGYANKDFSSVFQFLREEEGQWRDGGVDGWQYCHHRLLHTSEPHTPVSLIPVCSGGTKALLWGTDLESNYHAVFWHMYPCCCRWIYVFFSLFGAFILKENKTILIPFST